MRTQKVFSRRLYNLELHISFQLVLAHSSHPYIYISLYPSTYIYIYTHVRMQGIEGAKSLGVQPVPAAAVRYNTRARGREVLLFFMRKVVAAWQNEKREEPANRRKFSLGWLAVKYTEVATLCICHPLSLALTHIYTRARVIFPRRKRKSEREREKPR